MKVLTKALRLVGYTAAITLLLTIGLAVWWLLSLRQPEAEMAKLSFLTKVRAEDFEELGLAFHAESERVRLSSEQLRRIAGRYGQVEEKSLLRNEYGFEYLVSVMRRSDSSAPNGYNYHWLVRDVGRDGKEGTEDDLGDVWASRP